MSRLLAVFAFALLLASTQSLAANGWYKDSSGNGNVLTNLPRTTVGPKMAFFLIDNTASLSSFSKAFDVHEAFDLELTLITDTNGTAGSCEVKVWETFAAPGATVSASTGLPQISSDVDGDGVQDDLSLDGSSKNRRSIRHFKAARITIEIVALPGAGEQCALKVQGD